MANQPKPDPQTPPPSTPEPKKPTEIKPATEAEKQAAIECFRRLRDKHEPT